MISNVVTALYGEAGGVGDHPFCILCMPNGCKMCSDVMEI